MTDFIKDVGISYNINNIKAESITNFSSVIIKPCRLCIYFRVLEGDLAACAYMCKMECFRIEYYIQSTKRRNKFSKCFQFLEYILFCILSKYSVVPVIKEYYTFLAFQTLHFIIISLIGIAIILPTFLPSIFRELLCYNH